MDKSYKHLKGKPMNVQDHPETSLPPRVSQVNGIYAPPTPEAALQGPQGPDTSTYF